MGLLIESAKIVKKCVPNLPKWRKKIACLALFNLLSFADGAIEKLQKWLQGTHRRYTFFYKIGL